MIPFVIRDDDLCYFSDASLIENLYGKIWNDFPVTFAVVPYQRGTVAGHVPVKHMHDNTIFSVGDNLSLVSLIKDQVNNGRCDIAMHGLNHTYVIKHHKMIPELAKYQSNFKEKIIKAKNYLEATFEKHISVFVPPSNTLSKHNYLILKSIGFNFLNLPGVRKNTRPSLSIPHQISRLQRIYFHKKYHFDSPIPVVKDHCWEVNGFALTPSASLNSLKNALRYCVDHGYPFVLATHYWEHACVLPSNSDRTQYDVLNEFLDFASKFSIKPVGASELGEYL